MITLQSGKPDYGQTLLNSMTQARLQKKKQQVADTDMFNKLSSQGFEETQEGDQGAMPIQFGDQVRYFRQKQYKPEDMTMKLIGETPDGGFYQQYNNVTQQFMGKPEHIKNKGKDLPTAEQYAIDKVNEWKVGNPDKAVPAGLYGDKLLEYKRLNADDIYKQTKAKEKAKFEIDRVKVFPKMRQDYANKNREWDTLDTTIDRVLKNANAITTGLASKVTRHIAGTDSFLLARDLETIAALISFNKLTEMRRASPSGGALGQVSNFENKLLQATSGSLDQGLKADQLKQNLKVIKKYLRKFREDTDDWYYEDYGDMLVTKGQDQSEKVSGESSQLQGPPVGTERGGYRFKGGDPNDQNNWEVIK